MTSKSWTKSRGKFIKFSDRNKENGGDKTDNGREFHKMDAAQLSRALDQLASATPSPPESDGQANDKRKGENYEYKFKRKTKDKIKIERNTDQNKA